MMVAVVKIEARSLLCEGRDKVGSSCYSLFNVVLETALRDYKQ